LLLGILLSPWLTCSGRRPRSTATVREQWNFLTKAYAPDANGAPRKRSGSALGLGYVLHIIIQLSTSIKGRSFSSCDALPLADYLLLVTN